MVRWHRNSKTLEWSHEGSRSLENDSGSPIQEHHVFPSSVDTTYAALGVSVYNITQDTHVTQSKIFGILFHVTMITAGRDDINWKSE